MGSERKLTDAQKQVADIIYQREAIKFGSFKLKLHEKDPKAPLSPIHATIRKPPGGPLTDKDIEAIGREIYVLVKRRKILFDAVAGIPRAGEPIAEVVARLAKRPLVKLGKTTEGGKRKIDSVVGGKYRRNQLVLLIDDLINQADTKKEAIAACEEAGLIVVGIAVLIDREQGGAQDLGKAGYALHAVFPLSVLLDYYVQASRIDFAKMEEVMEYVARNRI